MMILSSDEPWSSIRMLIFLFAIAVSTLAAVPVAFLIPTPTTAISAKLSSKEINPIDEEIEVKMYDYIRKKLASKKFNHYEISNFALNNYESIHNLTYWDNLEYYGFGLGAHGFIEGFRYENTRNPSA